MKLQLINGFFSKKDALDILSQMVHQKIKYHESKINLSGSEEDIKTREKRIKDLQRDLFEVRQYIEKNQLSGIDLQADIVLTVPESVAV
jgi:hypothetical protein